MIDSLMLSFAAAFGWGFSPIFARIALKHYDNITFIVLRAIFVGILCLGYILFSKNSIRKQITKTGIKSKPFLYMTLASLVVFLGSICYYTAIYKKSQDTIIISLISYIIPLLVITLASYLFFGDKINIKMILGMILTIIGVSMVVYYNPN